MADYDPTIPAANDILSQSQSDIQNNFSELNTIFDVDHLTWNSNPSGNRGFHRQITMPEGLAAAPTPITTQGIVYPLADVLDTNADVQMYYANASTVSQLTNAFLTNADPGVICLPGGLFVMWGRQNTFSGSGVQPITFPVIANYAYSGGQTQGFPNNLLNIQISMGRDDSTDKQLAIKTGTGFPTKLGFSLIYSSSSMNRVYWFAIGN